jgi:hypothetical protein
VRLPRTTNGLLPVLDRGCVEPEPDPVETDTLPSTEDAGTLSLEAMFLRGRLDRAVAKLAVVDVEAGEATVADAADCLRGVGGPGWLITSSSRYGDCCGCGWWWW